MRIEDTLVAGQPALKMTADDGASATVLRHGAHLVSWQPTPADERLYLSPTTRFGEGEAVRGGVPVIFPRFALTDTNADVPRHGFVRTRRWAHEQQSDACTEALILTLVDDPSTRALWPRPFSIACSFALGPSRLSIGMKVCNTGAESFEFTAALHTYLAVADIDRVRIRGLGGCHFHDKVTDTRSLQNEASLEIVGEVDRVYRSVPGPVVLEGNAGALTITQEGFEDVVVWNPSAERCAALPDMPDDDWRRMLCIEAARIERPLRLAPGECWSGQQTFATLAAASTIDYA